MTLLELSTTYLDSADLLRTRIRELRLAQREAVDPEVVRQLQSRISALGPLLKEMRELAALTAHYYNRGYHRNEKYSL